MKIRKANLNDTHSCVRLIELAMDGIIQTLGLNQNALERLFSQSAENSRLSHEHISVVETGSEVVAAMGCYDGATQGQMDAKSGIKISKECFSGELYIDFIATFKNQRKKGYASALLKSADEIARAKNLSKIALIVKQDKIKNIKFYESLGFKKDDKILAYGFSFLHMIKEIR